MPLNTKLDFFVSNFFVQIKLSKVHLHRPASHELISSHLAVCDWLLTNLHMPCEIAYNFHQSSAQTTVKRSC